MDGQLRFEVLGPVRAWRGESEVELGSPQQRAILGSLLLWGGGVATPEQLISSVWGPTAPTAAVGMVRSYVSRLRRALGDGRPATVIRSVAGGYVMPAGPGTLDVTDFQRRIGVAREARHTGDLRIEATELRAALALWKGTPLTGVRGEYADRERTRLIQLRLAAVEDLAAADLELGRHTEAADALVPLVIEQPLRERPRELLMLALYRCGRQADALAVYQETQRLLADELGLDPGPELREMQRRVLRSDPTLSGPLAVHQPPAPQLVEPPMQLPPDLPEFTGRADLAIHVAAVLAPTATTVPVLGLTGLAGVGKTSLAIHVGHGVVGDFPDGQFFADLGGHPEALPGLLRGIGVANEAVPPSPAEQSALWRTLTSERRLLLVLDDAQDVEQIHRLLPGPGGAAVILTSRQRHLGLAHARWLKLDGLTEDESLVLLERLIGAHRLGSQTADARRLVRMTSGQPSVVHAIGARLAARPGWSLATALRRLGDHGGDLTLPHPDDQAIEGPYGSALRDLAPAQARAVRLLAVPDGPDISLGAAAAVLGVTPDEADGLLEAVLDTHLLEVSESAWGSGERYHYLNPVRGFARRRALLDDGQAECHAALVRLGHFYLATAHAALSHTAPGLGSPEGGFETEEAARTWLLVEHQHLWACATQTADVPGAPSEQLARLLDHTLPVKITV